MLIVLVLLLVVSVPSITFADVADPAGGSAGSADALEQCVDRNRTYRSARGTAMLRSTDRVGAVTEQRATIQWKLFEEDRSRVHVRFDDPPDVRGSALLLIQKKGRADMFMYLPDLHRSRRVTGRSLTGSFFGTDFSYEQLERMQGMAGDAKLERLPDVEFADRTVQVLSHSPEPDAHSQFERIVSYVDPETCVPLKTDYFESGSEPRKSLIAKTDKIARLGDNWVPHEVVMKDHRDGTQTAMILEKMEVDVEISRKVFSQTYLERGD